MEVAAEAFLLILSVLGIFSCYFSVLLFFVPIVMEYLSLHVNHSSVTTAPMLSNAFFSFSASSLDTFSFNTFGADSTSFFAFW